MTVKRDGRGRIRRYDEEYRKYGSSTKAKKDRAARNAARREAEKKYGKEAIKGKDVGHTSLLKNAKNPRKVGWKIESRHKNRGKSNRATH